MSVHRAVESVVRHRPDSWDVIPFRRLAVERGVRNAVLAEQALSLASSGRLYERTEETDRQFGSEASERNRWVVHPGDLVVNPMWLLGGAIGVCDRRGAVSPDYRVYALSDRLQPRFLHHLLRSDPYRDQYRLYMRAETTFDRRVGKEDFGELPILVPPILVQRAIADYLDAETARIDTLLSTYERMAQALSDRASAQVALLFDGAPVRLKHLVTKIGSGKTPLGGAEAYVKEGVAFIRSMNVRNGYFDLSDLAHIEATQDVLMASTRLLPGDVLLNITGASIGRSAVVPPELGPANVNQHVCILRPRSGVSGELLAAALLTADVQSQVRSVQVGGNRDGLTFDQVADLLIRWPEVGKAAGSEALVRAAQEWSKAAMRTLGAQSSLLLERRQALITAAVTGELDISAVAA